MASPGLLDRARSVLVVVDVQEKLLPAIPDRDRLLGRVALLLDAARALGVPVIATEQYPRGLGATVAVVRDALPAGTTPLEKTMFSCAAAPGFRERLAATGRDQVVLAGIEAHVCVAQTALELAADVVRTVFVAADGVASRRADDARVALDRLRGAGITLLPAESVVFEWLRDAARPEFKALQPALKALG